MKNFVMTVAAFLHLKSESDVLVTMCKVELQRVCLSNVVATSLASFLTSIVLTKLVVAQLGGGEDILTLASGQSLKSAQSFGKLSYAF